jgi:hypothetical protein
MTLHLFFVIPGLDPGIACSLGEMAGSRPAMTNEMHL